jgi:hypothetical protein
MEIARPVGKGGMRHRRLLPLLAVLTSLCAQPAWGQAVGQAFPQQDVEPIQQALGRVTCPGDPPGNLGSLSCEYTKTMRLQKFFGGSVTDQAVLSASFFGTVAQLRKSPPEWERDWEGLGRRVGTRYGQSFAKGLTVLGVGLIMRDDPRLVDYASDPLIDRKQRQRNPMMGRERRGRTWTRVGHAIVDWATVRKSTPAGDGGRRPNWPLFAGAVASGVTGNLWYPDRLTTRTETSKRIGGSLGTALFASFYNEFQPELGRVLGRMFRRGATSTSPATPASQP